MIVFAILLTLITVGFTQEITGAFGIKFGEQLDNLEVTDKGETTSGETLYIVKPRKPIKLLPHYVVGVTPISKKVYAIWE